jgi:hypothetical protein
VVLVRKKDNNQIYALKMLKKSYIQKRKQINHIISERNILVRGGGFNRIADRSSATTNSS